MSSKDFLSPSDALPPLKDLPDDILVLIGRIVVKNSYLELLLSRIIYQLVEVQPVIGRVAVREPRLADRLAMIEDLALVKGIKLNRDAFKLLRRDLPKVTSFRDSLAHGIYFTDPATGSPAIRLTSGKWQPPGMTKGSIKAIIHPPTKLLTPDNLEKIVTYIDTITNVLEITFLEIQHTLSTQP